MVTAAGGTEMQAVIRRQSHEHHNTRHSRPTVADAGRRPSVRPDDTVSAVDDKVQAWLDAGARMVWVVNPKWPAVTVYPSATDIKTLTENDELSGEDTVPGFRCRVGEIFVGT